MKNILAKIWRKLNLPKNFQLSIMRAKEDQFLVGVTGVFFNEKKEVLLLHHTYRQTKWSLPGGYIKGGEHPFESIEREVNEESGFVVSADSELKVRTDRQSARLDICVIGKFIGGEFKKSAEVDDFGFFTFDNLPKISNNQLFLINQAKENLD